MINELNNIMTLHTYVIQVLLSSVVYCVRVV
jgi:hypothetical protein